MEPNRKLMLRKADSSDREFAYSARTAAFREYVEKLNAWNEDEQRRLHERRFDTQDFRILGLAGRNVGILALEHRADCIKVNQLLLLPEHQGQGIGQECMQLIMNEARELKLPIHLRVLKVNPRAQAFYQRLGFSSEGETSTHHLMTWAST